MRNIETSVEGGILTIKVDLNAEATESSSGKTKVLASSKGSKPVAPDSNIVFGLNVFHPIKEKKHVPADTQE